MNGYFLYTKFWKLVLVKDQMYLGRLVIKTIEPRQALPELTKEEQEDFFTLIKNLEDCFKKEFGATMFNYSCLMNNAYRDGEVPHVHFHFRPRYDKSITILGKTFTDPNFGEHYISPSLSGSEGLIIDEDVRQYLQEKILNYFDKLN